MQRILKKNILFIMVIFMVYAPVSGSTNLRLGNVNVNGDSSGIKLPLYLTNDEDVAGFEFSIKDDVAAVKIDSVLPAGRAVDFIARHRNNKVILFSLSGRPVQQGEGKIAVLMMNINKEKIADIDTVRFTSQTILADRAGESIEVQTVPGVISFDLISGINRNNNHLPTVYALEQNYPNPFNNSTTIRFAVVEKGNAVIKLYNILGEETETIFNGTVNPGWHSIQFQANQPASGLYIYKINVNGFTAVHKLLLMK